MIYMEVEHRITKAIRSIKNNNRTLQLREEQKLKSRNIYAIFAK